MWGLPLVETVSLPLDAQLLSQPQRRVTAMSFRPPELVIDTKKPFKEDTLAREPQVESYAN